MLKSMQGLSLPLPQLAQIQSDYVKQATEVWNQSLQRLQPPAAPAEAAQPVPIGDRRLAARERLTQPAAALTAQPHPINARGL